MKRVLAHVPRNQCVVYLDDLLVHATDFDLALENLNQVFRALTYTPRNATSSGARPSSRIMWWEQRGVATDPAKVEAVRKWPVP